MLIRFTAASRQVPEGYVGVVEELSGANSYGATIEEARNGLREAVALVLEANRVVTEESLRGQDLIREPHRIQPA